MLVQKDPDTFNALSIEDQHPVKIDFRSGFFRSQLLKKDPGRLNKKGTFLAYFSENPSKAIILGLIFLSVFILFIVKYRGDSSTLLCTDTRNREYDNPNPYPNANFGQVDKLKDKGRFHVVKASKWVVLATSNPPSEKIKAMAKMQGWQLLIVGDSETPDDYDVKGAVFLSIEQQSTLGFRILSHLPYNSYVRKCVGYLFAIQHGAKMIYDGDENASFLDNDIGKAFDVDLSSKSGKKTLLEYLPSGNRTTLNPYIHFGQRSVWPRGLPLEVISNINADIYYGHVPHGRQLIQQGLANGLPDVDAIFYNTRKSVSEAFDVSFDPHALPVALPRGTMAPINNLNTLFHLEAFWALMLPVSVNPHVSDVFRGYWAQRLLWEIGGYVAFYPPSVYRADLKHSLSFEDENDLHEKASRLVDFLVGWSSTKGSFFERVLDLSHSMAEAGVWAPLDVAYTADWLQDLLSVGYTQPALSIFEEVNQSELFEFVPLALPSLHLGVQDTSTVGFEIGNLMRWKRFYGNIVLVMECTWPVNQTALAWRMLYGRIFRNVVLLSTQSDARFGVMATEDWQSYKVLPDIFQRYAKADGFLYIKDHAILNYWNLLQADRTKPWNLQKVNQAWKVVGHKENGTEWYQKSSVKRTVKNMVKSLPVHFRITYRENMDNGHYAVSTSDAFYVPRRLVADFVDLVGLAAQAKLHQELAIPLFFLCMEHIENYDMEAFSHVVYESDSASTVYTAEAHIVSPLQARDQHQLLHIMKYMAAGDPLLLEVL